MRNLVPLTKILLTLGTAVWAIIFREPFSLALLCVLELIILLVSNELFKNVKALMMLCVFAFFLGLIEYIGGGTEKECAVAALRMLGMTIIFIYLLATVRLQDLTAAMVRPLMLRSLGRSETMALSLELRGFGGSTRTFMESVSPKGIDYIFMLLIILFTVAVIYARVLYGA